VIGTAGNTIVNLAGKNPGTTYNYKIAAKNIVGLGTFSPEFSITTTTCAITHDLAFL
jgi:hypothetical protein